MSGNLFPRFLDYLPPVIALAAAVAALVGSPKWDATASGLYRITALGWEVLGIGALAFVASVLVIAKNGREQQRQRVARERVAAIGRRALLSAIVHSVHPFIVPASLWSPLGRPSTPRDLLDPVRRDAIASLDLTSVSPYMEGSQEEISWHAMFQRAAREGRERIITALQIYSTYLSADVMDAVTGYLTC